MSKEQKQSLKLWEPGSFDVHKNAAAPMIAMLGPKRSITFSFCLAENVSKFVILGRDIREIRSFCKFCGVSLNVRRTKTEFEIVGARKF